MLYGHVSVADGFCLVFWVYGSWPLTKYRLNSKRKIMCLFWHKLQPLMGMRNSKFLVSPQQLQFPSTYFLEFLWRSPVNKTQVKFEKGVIILYASVLAQIMAPDRRKEKQMFGSCSVTCFSLKHNYVVVDHGQNTGGIWKGRQCIHFNINYSPWHEEWHMFCFTSITYVLIVRYLLNLCCWQQAKCMLILKWEVIILRHR